MKPVSGMPGPPSIACGSKRDSYSGVVIVLLVAALLGAAGAFAGGLMLASVVLLDVAVTLGLSAGILVGVVLARRAATPPRDGASTVDERETLRPGGPRSRIWSRLEGLDRAERVRFTVAALGVLGIGYVFLAAPSPVHPTSSVAAIAAGLCLVAAAMAATAAHYFAGVEPATFPESPELSRGARVVTWILVLAAVSMGAAWLWQRTVLHVLHFLVLTINVAACYGLFAMKRPKEVAPGSFPLDLGVSSVLGGRRNIMASILDAAQQQLGIDLRSTWALTVVRHSVEPVVIVLCLIGWLSTSLTVVGVQEQGLVEHLGVPAEGEALRPGLHLHWPWPVDRVFRVPVQRVQTLQVGHEGEEEGGPENVLWAREHAPNEYSLLLGNGRDLITIDAAVQFLIVDPRAWRYHSQNPADALRAIAYRAVMRSTVSRTLSDALSENVVTLTGSMRAMVQREADAMGLGVKVLGFTVGGMHPPVPVASDYEAVVSAELGKVTAAVDAQTYLNRTVPAAEASVIEDADSARAEGAEALGRAAGEAWSFRTLESQYRSAPEEYLFRRRLETLEDGLAGRGFTVVDSRIQRDGGELWLFP